MNWLPTEVGRFARLYAKPVPTYKERHKQQTMTEQKEPIDQGLLNLIKAGALVVVLVGIPALIKGCYDNPIARDPKPKAAVVASKPEKKPPAKVAPKVDYTALYEKGRKDLFWAIDDPDMGYLDVLESKSSQNNGDVYSYVQEEIWHFVENNYGELPPELKSKLKREGLEHLDCRIERSCPAAPKFSV